MSDDKVTLGDGSEIGADIFENLENKLLSETPSEFEENRFSRARATDPVTPFTASPNPTVKNVAKKRHAERSDRAQHVDEQYNAPIAPDYNTWLEHKNRYDLPDVDTVPEDELGRRGNRFLEGAQELGAVDEVKRETINGTKKGEFQAKSKKQETEGGRTLIGGGAGYETKIQADPEFDDSGFLSFTEGTVLAHETGHAMDFEVAPGNQFGSKGDFFKGREEDLKEEAVTLSERMRGKIEKGTEKYREDERELVADAFASMAVEPRAAKREAPNLVGTLEDEFVDYVDDGDILDL